MLPLKQKYQKNALFDAILNVIIVLLVVSIAFLIYFNTTYTRVYVVGDSMQPNLYGAVEDYDGTVYVGGDYVICKKQPPTYGDIVVVNRKTSIGYRQIIKRVIALEGDSVYLEEGKLYVKYADSDNFVLVTESYVLQTNNDPTINNYPLNAGILNKSGHLVADNCMFLLGDNRNVSLDSRNDAYGDFNVNELVGVVQSWSLTYKKSITNWFTFWDFTLPNLFF